MNNGILLLQWPEAEDWHLFNAVEVEPVCAHEGIVEVIDECEIGDIAEADYFWSVYLRFDPTMSGDGDFGGVVCMADCVTKADAYKIAEGFESRLRDVIGERLIPMREAQP